MLIFLLWIVFAFLVAAFGDKRRIGFGWTLFIAIIFSPLVGFIVALLSAPKPTAADIALGKMQAAMSANAEASKVDQLERLSKLKADGTLTPDEFEREKARVLSSHSDPLPKPPEPSPKHEPPPPRDYDIPLR